MSDFLKEQATDPQSIKFEAGSFPEVEVIERELMNALSGSKGTVREMCSHILNAGGKRVRPLLVLFSGLVFSEVRQELVQAAVASELIHMASLVHDDIIDKSGLRRNKPSINYIWGNQYAVLCGDYLFARAFGILAENRLLESMDYMVEAIENMCQGEVNQASAKYDTSVTTEAYYRRIAQKTAIFLKCCCQSGAFVGGAGQVEVEALGEYGLQLGYAFQIIDDILDFCGDIQSMGKPNCEDLRDGNITLPVLLLLKDAEYGEWAKGIISAQNLTEEALEEIKTVLQSRGILSRAFEAAGVHIEKARNCLKLLPQNQYTQYLEVLADMLQRRIN